MQPVNKKNSTNIKHKADYPASPTTSTNSQKNIDFTSNSNAKESDYDEEYNLDSSSSNESSLGDKFKKALNWGWDTLCSFGSFIKNGFCGLIDWGKSLFKSDDSDNENDTEDHIDENTTLNNCKGGVCSDEKSKDKAPSKRIAEINKQIPPGTKIVSSYTPDIPAHPTEKTKWSDDINATYNQNDKMPDWPNNWFNATIEANKKIYDEKHKDDPNAPKFDPRDWHNDPMSKYWKGNGTDYGDLPKWDGGDPNNGNHEYKHSNQTKKSEEGDMDKFIVNLNDNNEKEWKKMYPE